MIYRRASEDSRALMILGARRAQLAAIRTGLKLGLKIVAIDPDPTAPGLELATIGLVYDLADQDAILAEARKHEIDGIMTMAADYPMPTIGHVCAALDLPGPHPDAVARATNKRLMRIALSAAGVRCPRFFHVDSLAQARQAVSDLGAPVVFKPAMSQGGRGVTRIPAGCSDAGIERAFLRALRETRKDDVLVEEFVDGPEFSIETLTHAGTTKVVAVTDKLTSGAPYFVELGHNQPSRWSTDQVELLCDTAIQAVTALGIDRAAGHTEIRLGSSGPVVMEVAARLGGGFITSHLVPFSTGVDLVAAAIRLAMGAAPDLLPRKEGRAAAVRFLSAPSGVVTRVEGLDAARRMEGVEEIEIYVQPNDYLGPLMDASGRAGHVICRAQEPERAILLAERAMRSIRILTETGAATS